MPGPRTALWRWCRTLRRHLDVPLATVQASDVLVFFYGSAALLAVHIAWKVAHRKEGEGFADAVQRQTVFSGILYVVLALSYVGALRTGAF